MSRIFLSHSSADNAAAVALRDWLVASGWDDLFLDLDPERGIVAGERWSAALNEAADRCEAVLFLVSRSWLDSAWCLMEFNLAARLNKRMFGVLVEDIPYPELPDELTKTWQLVNLAAGKDHRMFPAKIPPDEEEVHVTFSASGLARLKNGLSKAGLDAGFFEWPPANDPDRAPYRGLRPLEAEDAGIFFGREAPTIALLDRLRGLREAAPPRFLVILGASGAGKSSFLRAGLVPRLERDDRHFVALPVIRPERAALSGETGLIRSLEIALKRAGIAAKRANLKAAVEEGAGRLLPLLQELADKSRLPDLVGEATARAPGLIVSIDQGEELLFGEGAEEARQFLVLLKDMVLARTPDVIAVVTIRSDAYERLQTAKALEGIRQEPFSLPPMPQGSYQTVVEGPAKRLAKSKRPLRIEPALTQRLLADIEKGGGKDALPLLAFTLERLYADYGGDGELQLSDYEALGGLEGSIEAAVAAALRRADQDRSVPKDHEARLALLRRGLIPWLAGIDPETNAPRRRVARYGEIPDEARPLIGHLIEARLLATDVDPETRERTVEPAHEALLRQWGLLQGWLVEDLAALTTLEGVQRAARDWLANDRDAGWLSHAAGRLEDAERLRQREDLAPILTRDDWAYLEACRASEDQRRDRELSQARQLAEEQGKVARLTRFGLIAACLLAAFAIAAAVYGWRANNALLANNVELERAKSDLLRNAGELRKQLQLAQQRESLFLAERARNAIKQREFTLATLIALEALPDPARGTSRPYAYEAAMELGDAFPHTVRPLGEPMTHDGAVVSAVFSADGKRVVTASRDKTARLWDGLTGAPIGQPMKHEDRVGSAVFSLDGKRIVTASWDGTARLWDGLTGAPIGQPMKHEGQVRSAAFSPDGQRIVTASDDMTARLWDGLTGAPIGQPMKHAGQVRSAVFSPDGKRIVTASWDGTARLWDGLTGAPIGQPMKHEGQVMSAVFSPDGQRIVTASWDKTARLWDGLTGAPVGEPMKHDARAISAAFSPDGQRIVTASWGDKTARLWDGLTGAPIGQPMPHGFGVISAVFSPDGQRIVTASADNMARLWDGLTGAPVGEPMKHEGPVASAVFSPDGKRVLTASWDKTARLWNRPTGGLAGVSMRHGDLVRSADFSPDGKRILTASDDNTARLWDGLTGAPIGQPMKHDKWIRSAAFSPDGKRIVTVSWDQTARLWDGLTGAPVGEPMKHDARVNSAAFSPDGKRVVTASWDKTARLWDGFTGAPIGAPMEHEQGVNSAAFSPDGKRIVTASGDMTARLWDGLTGAPVGEPMKHGIWVLTATFSPDGKRVVTASSDGTARLWDGFTGAAIGKPMRHDDWVRSAVFSSDGKRVVTASSDGTARLWDGLTGAPVGEPMKHQGKVLSAVFSPDGKRVVTASADGTARLWDGLTGATIGEPMRHEGQVLSAAFSPDGKRIVTASSDHTARLWSVFGGSEEDFIAEIRMKMWRCMTARERAALYLDPMPDIVHHPNYCHVGSIGR